MRRITLYFVSTMAAIALLFSYKTSRPAGDAQIAALGSAAHVVSRSSVVGGTHLNGSAPPPVPSTAQTPAAATTSTPTGKAKPTVKAKPAQNSAPVVVDGSAVDTNYGPVQVQVTISNRKIIKVTVPQYPTGNGRDVEINGFALPQLIAEVLSVQSATIDAVSGATYTSQGFQTSLQSALDAAHFAQ